MLAQIPRKPVFPEHIIKKEIARVQADVENEVIPVSAGIYSQYKLNQRLQAIPKPILVDYEDPIFYQLADIAKMPCRSTSCPLCGQLYGSKQRKPIQCKFCGVWNCSHCICPRKRYHPRAKESNSQRYDICYNCDDKFLNLTMNHAFIQRRSLWSELIKRVRQERDQVANEVDRFEEKAESLKEGVQKNKFKISGLKKEKIDNEKKITNLKEEKRLLLKRAEERQAYLRDLIEKKNRKGSQRGRGNDHLGQTLAKPTRTLSQMNVISEAVFQDKVKPQKQQQTLQPPINSVQQFQPKVEGSEEKVTMEPQKVQSKPDPEPVRNFFNYHEWGRQQQEQAGLFKPKENDYREEIKLNQSVEEETILDTLSPSPQYQQEGEPEEHHQTLTQKKFDEIFLRHEQARLTYDEDFMQTSSLEGEALEEKKKAIVRAAIECHQNQQSFEQFLEAEVRLQKCACIIY